MISTAYSDDTIVSERDNGPADWVKGMRSVPFMPNKDGLDIHQLEADLEDFAAGLGHDFEKLAEQAGRHFTSDVIVPSRIDPSSPVLDEMVNDEIEAFRA